MISAVHVIHPSENNLYTCRDLLHSPHYGCPVEDLPKLIECARHHGIPVKEYHSHKSYLRNVDQTKAGKTSKHLHDFVQVVNGNTDEWQPISKAFNQIFNDFQITDREDTPIEIDVRNNLQQCGGFASRNLERDPKGGVYSGKPQCGPLSKKQISTMRRLSGIARKLKMAFVELIEEDSDRLQTFAQTIDPKNIFEGIVLGSYPDCIKNVLTCHLDTLNCCMAGYQDQIVVSKITLNADGTPRRDFAGAYGRLCCAQFLQRENQSKSLAQMASRFIQSRPSSVRNVSDKLYEAEKVLIPETEEWDQEDRLYAKEVCMDKAALYSYFRAVHKKLTPISNNLFRHIEVSICASLCSTPDLLWRVFYNLRQGGRLHDGSSWLLNFVDEMAENGGCNSGYCHRCVPSFNHETDYRKLTLLCVSVYQLVEEANQKILPSDDDEEADKKTIREYYLYLSNQIKNNRDFLGLGGLMGQHLLQYLIFSGIIKHPVLANYARFAPSTETFARLVDVIGGNSLSGGQASNLLRDMASQVRTTENVMENVTCEMLKPPSKQRALLDPYLHGQEYCKPFRRPNKSGKYVWKLYSLSLTRGVWLKTRFAKLDSGVPSHSSLEKLKWWQYIDCGRAEITLPKKSLRRKEFEKNSNQRTIFPYRLSSTKMKNREPNNKEKCGQPRQLQQLQPTIFI